MAARAVVAGAALVAALGTTVAMPPAAADGSSCSDASVAAGPVAAGAVGKHDPEQWWMFAGVPGTYDVVLTSSVGDADLGVTDGDCNPLCSRDKRLGLERCTVAVPTLGLRAVARSRSSLPASYVITATLVKPALVGCSDGLDNDGDTFVDLADAGCDNPLDPSEDGAPCYDVANVDVCVEVVPGAVTTDLTPVAPDTHEVAGFVDTYKFVVAGAPVTVDCVVLVVKPLGTNDTCRFAGGRFVKRRLTLYEGPPGVPRSSWRDVRLDVCEAEVALTAFGERRAFDAYVLC